MLTSQSRLTAANRARDFLARQPLFLDTETTGTTTTSEVIEICIIDHEGSVLLDSLIKPARKIPSDATRIHGIDNGMVMNAPTWSDLWPQIAAILSQRSVGIYNAEFDLRLIKQTHLQSGLNWQSLNASALCLMKLYAEFYGDWDRYRGGYRWQSLSDAGRQTGISLPNAHRAKADTLLARQLLIHMVNYTSE